MKKIFILFTVLFFALAPVNAATINTEAMLQYNQGIDYYKIGQYDAAIDCFRTAIRIDPNYIDAYYNLGSVLEYMQQYDSALAVFKQIIVRKPDDYDSVYKAAWLSYKMGEDQKAKTYLSIIPPNSPRGKDAQALAAQLNYVIPVPAPKKTVSDGTKSVELPPKPKISQTSGIYQNVAAPTGIATDTDGNVYIAEYNNNSIVKITPDDKKIVFVKDPKISGPIGLVRDKSGNFYVANYNKNNVLKISPLGEITVLISNVQKPYGLHIDGKILFISCQGSNSVLRYKLP